ncbi:Guanylate cyclase-related protein [hydrothermal vent metagenome]|uniref:Guanylate cyclase-related protein n=1 Tax=hydrothermal vent metagenome TaxID=652676 RepID=A0A1W1C2S9_9ZZZZ
MKGMIFTELFELVEEKFGFELLDDVIVEAKLPNDGSYAATGNYPFSELLKVVVSLSNKSGIPIPDLLEVFGEHLFSKLVGAFPHLVEKQSLLHFITEVENYIHVEVKKLYPDVELPKFDIVKHEEKVLKFYYLSDKKLHHLAKGLLKGAAVYFKEDAEIGMDESDNSRVLFTIKIV